jgi:polysaccharide export outer membrane protein
VSVKELLSRPVTVTGAVRNPGVFQVTGSVRLLRLLSMAGGFSEDVGTRVDVLRQEPGGETHQMIVVVQELREGKSQANLEIHAGDTINVEPAGAVYVLGAVNHPGRYLLRSDAQQTTILHVLALAEDLKRTAKPGSAVLIRKLGEGTNVEQIPVNIRMILEHKQQDVVVQANDVLYVPDSTAKRAFSRGLEAAVQLATGMIILRRP